MRSGSDSPHLGAHHLGPHVVGQRVVVRRLLGERGPTGGPAFTDVLGVCTAWGDGVCVVAPATGEPVTIPIALIVSGKPVPPRPSWRHRVSAREAEGHALALWPKLVRRDLGDWVMRSSDVPFKRANSCLAIGDPGMTLDHAEFAVRAFYEGRGRQPLVQVEADSPEEAHFAEAGWTLLQHGEAAFQLAALAAVRRRLGSSLQPSDVRLRVEGHFAHVQLLVGGDVVASGRAGLDGDWIGIHAFGVDDAHRRQGLGTLVLAELLEWGAEQGASTVWLHVETDNEPALALYGSLGFVTHHTCRYLSAD
jgi:ribosomal protein S18 acetylase RimI-like enzyme